MTTAVVDEIPWWRRVATNAETVIMVGGIVAVACMAFFGAFSHMHDWTVRSVPHTTAALAWGNAVISEIMPTVSFLSLRKREEQKRSVAMPGVILVFSVALSLLAQLSAVVLHIPAEKYLLACLPAIALLALSKMVFADFGYAREQATAAAEAAARAAASARQQAARAAELARQQAADAAALERQQAAELAARLRQQEADHAQAAAAAAREQTMELARIAAETDRRRLELEAAERRADREARERTDLAAARIEAEGKARAAAVEAAARAERIAAETALIAAETAQREQAAALLAARTVAAPPAVSHDQSHLSSHETGGETGTGRRRRTREETEALVDAVLLGLPDGTTRDEAVAAVSAGIDNMQPRNARNYVPSDWAPGMGVNAERALRLVAMAG